MKGDCVIGAGSGPRMAAGARRAASILLVIVVVAQLCLAPGAFAQAPGAGGSGSNPRLLTQSPPEDALGPVDWVLVVDTSASMAGRERGALNIFPAVQETLRRFVPEIREDDTLTIIVFDETSRIVSATVPKRLRGLLDREAVVRLINSLSARGLWTHTGAALTDALKEVYSRPDGSRPAAIILLTDGHEDVRGIKNPIRIPDAIRIIRDQDVPYVFYVSLGTEPDPGVMEFLAEINKKSAGRGRSFNDPGASRLLDNAREIRRLMSVTRMRPLQLKPGRLDVGRIRPGGSAKSPPLEVLCPVPASLRLRLLEVPAGLRVAGVPEALACGPQQWGQVRMEVTASDDAGQGGQTFKLEVEPDGLIKGLDPAAQVIEVTLDVRETAFETVAGWVLRHWWWLLLLILLILLIVYLLRQWYIYGDTPLELIRRWLARWQPRPPAMLRTPDGEIRLQESVTLGGGASVLSRSPATVAMHRVGNDYYLIVEKGAVTVVDPSGLLKHAMKSGDEKMKLKHKSQIIMPGYSSPLLYLNSAVLRRS